MDLETDGDGKLQRYNRNKQCSYVLHYVYPDRERAQAGLSYLRATGLFKTTD